jgi:hypothetical protein
VAVDLKEDAVPEPWGGHENGRIPREELAVVQLAENARGERVGHFRLRADAAAALDRLLAQMPAGQRYMTDAYRDYETQVRLKAEKGRYAATPGTSNHGWAMAADLAAAHERGAARWLWANRSEALRHGWYPPSWTHDGRGIEEPWHWEYDHKRDQFRGSPVAPADRPVAADEEDQVKKGAKDAAGGVRAVEHLQRLVNGVNGRSSRLDGWESVPGVTVDGHYGDGTARALGHALGRAKHYLAVDLPGDPSVGVSAAEVALLAQCVVLLGERLAAKGSAA